MTTPRLQWLISVLAALGLLSLTSGLAFAQEDAPADETSGDAAEAPPATDTAQLDDPQIDNDAKIREDIEKYWKGRRSMPVIAGGKLFATERRMEVGLFFGVIANDDFFTYYPVGGRVSYSFDGIFGIELAGSATPTADRELTNFLEERGVRKDVDLGDQQLGRINLIGTFSPLYGKWSFQTYKISHFDLFLSLGVGAVFTEAPVLDDDGLPAPEPESRVTADFMIGAGFRFFVAEWGAIRVDFRQFLYPDFNDGVQAPSEVTFGFSYLTPALY